MVDIQSKEVIDKISEDLKVQPSLQIPRELQKQIQLSYNVNPQRLIQSRSAVAANATTTTIHTTSLVKDTFIVGGCLSVSQSALATSVQSTLTVTDFMGLASNVLVIATTTLIAENGQVANKFEPILLERGSTIRVTNATAIGTVRAAACAYFYEVDPQ